MIYFKQEDFNKCMKFLADKPDTVETQQELFNKCMHGDCGMLPDWLPITVKNMCIYSKIYFTKNNPESANWCSTMSDGSQVIWNRKYQKFYRIDAISINHCNYLDYFRLFTEINGIYTWLLENWSDWRFRETQKQLVAIWDGKYNEFFKNYWRQ